MKKSLNALIGIAGILNVAPAGASDKTVVATSSYISSAITDGLPKFSPAQAVNSPAPSLVFQNPEGPPGVISLPTFTVRNSKFPSEAKMMSKEERAKVAMDRFLGPADGLDRGVLNRCTLQQLWQKIPILGRLPFVGTPVHMTNEDRALDAAGANDNLPYPHPAPTERE